MPGGALSDVTVLDLTHHVAGPYATKLLAGFGAEVIKVEPPGSGDPLRSSGPSVPRVEGRVDSIPFLWLNTAKKSVTLDLRTDAGRDLFMDLVVQADVVIENFAPRVMPELGLGYEVLCGVNPDVIMTSISNFGQSGPYRDYEGDEIVLQALGGLMHLQGDPDKPPLCAGPAIVQYTAGMLAYLATLMALYRRQAGGGGQHLDISIQEACLDNIEVALVEYLRLGKVANRTGDEHPLVPWQLFPCRDGYAAVVGGPIRRWLKGADLFEAPQLLRPRYADMGGRMQHRDEVKLLLQPWLDRTDKKTVYERGAARGLAFGYLAYLDEAYRSPQLQERGFFQAIDHPTVGRLEYAGAPFRPSETPWKAARAPLLAEHNPEVLGRRLKRSTDEVKNLSRVGDLMVPPAALPLAGVRVVDLTHDWAGPHATRLLADYGAQVIRVEYARRMDLMRGGRKENQAYNHHPRWHQINRNKLSITLDLKGQADTFKHLVAVADVVVESSRPGVMDKLGLGYAALRQVKPDLIMLSMSAFGVSGPERIYPGYGGSIEALSGIQSLTAYTRVGPFRRIREMDALSGVLGASAVMTALAYRQRTGRGQWIDLSEMEGAISGLIGEQLLEHVALGTQAAPTANRHAFYAPQGCYRCAGEDQWIAISIRSDQEWQQLCEAIDRPELQRDPKFANSVGRTANHDLIDDIIGQWTATRSKRDAMYLLQSRGIAAGAVLSVADVADDPHLKARAFITAARDGSGLVAGAPFRFSEAETVPPGRGPYLGEHNQYVVREILGRPSSEVPQFREDEIGTAFDPEEADRLAPMLLDIPQGL